MSNNLKSFSEENKLNISNVYQTNEEDTLKSKSTNDVKDNANYYAFGIVICWTGMVFIQKYIYHKLHFTYKKDESTNENIPIHDISYHYQNFSKGVVMLIFTAIQIFFINHNFNSKLKKTLKETESSRNSNLLLGPLQASQMSKGGKNRHTLTNYQMAKLQKNSNFLTQDMILDTGNNKKMSLFKILVNIGIMISLSMITNFLRSFYVNLFISLFPLFIPFILNLIKTPENRINIELGLIDKLFAVISIITIIIILNPFTQSPFNIDNNTQNYYIINYDYFFGMVIGILFIILISIRIILAKYQIDTVACKLNYLIEFQVCSVFLITYGFIQISYKKAVSGVFPIFSFILIVLESILFILGHICFHKTIENIKINEMTIYFACFIPFGILSNYYQSETISIIEVICVLTACVILVVKYFKDRNRVESNPQTNESLL